jgi:N-acetylmuramoyl-L-alanine amidase
MMRPNVNARILMIMATAFVLLLTASFATKIKPESRKIKVVCIDPGHGGKDPGCHGDKIYEKDVALAISLKLGKYIKQYYPDVKVIYTRTTDVFVELNERAAIANRNHADIFICIHCNSACVRKKGAKKDVCNEEANGAETYVMGLHVAAGNLEVAKRENDAVLFEEDYANKYDLNINSDEAAIIYSTYQNLHLEESMRFAQLCQEQFQTRAGRVSKGVKQAGFLVLWKTNMPSVLIETGFLSSPAEERFLGSDKGQEHMSASIFRAFRGWKDEAEGAAKKYDDEMEKMAPYKVEREDTAGLRKPFNYISGVKPPVQQKPVVDTSKKTAVKPGSDTSKKVPEKPVVKPVVKPVADTTKKNPVVKPVIKPAADTSKKIVTKGDTSKATEGWPVVYRVQILSSDKPLKPGSSQFKGLSDTWHYEHKGVHKYTTGTYTTSEEALKRQAELRKVGFDQAFVVAFDKAGNRITIEEAKKLGRQ